MRIALHTGQLRQPVPGGIGRYVAALLEHLPAAGAEVLAFSGGKLRYALWHGTRRFGPGRATRAAEVVHAPSLAVPPPGGRPLVVTIHDLAFLNIPDTSTPRGRAFHQRGLAITRDEAAVVVVPSAAVAAEVAATGIDAARIQVVLHGVEAGRPPRDEALRSTLARLGVGSPFVLFVGTLEPRKGLGCLLDAFARVRRGRPEVSLVVAGARGWGPILDLERPGVVALGEASDPDLDVLYRSALALAVPSLHEGFGLPVLEAMTRGCPVVASTAGALPEVVGDAGLLVSPEDPEALAGALEQLAGDRELAVRLRESGHARASGFTWASSASGHLRAYRRALEGR